MSKPLNIQQAITQAMPRLAPEKQQELLDFMEFLLEKQRRQETASEIPQGKRRADILRRMAKRNAVSGITDPVAWQREIRQDRPLPGRE